MRADFDNAGSQQGLLRRRASVASSSKQNCLKKVKKPKKRIHNVRKKTSTTVWLFFSPPRLLRHGNDNFIWISALLLNISSVTVAVLPRASVDALKHDFIRQGCCCAPKRSLADTFLQYFFMKCEPFPHSPWRDSRWACKDHLFLVEYYV